MTARVDNLDNTSGWAKAGVVLRTDFTDDGSSAGYAAVVATPSNGVSFQRDSIADGYLDQLTNTAATVKAPVWLRLTRTATQVSAYYSTDGSTFTQVGSTLTLPSMAATQDAGVIHTAHSTTAGSARNPLREGSGVRSELAQATLPLGDDVPGLWWRHDRLHPAARPEKQQGCRADQSVLVESALLPVARAQSASATMEPTRSAKVGSRRTRRAA
ncbi:hypothetical protein [Streptomyces europaeiscabiei]|uniref:hypothetical protein n=1 Tax=Streptomyces europaeiscabiei TaxID=146819 RepID=UPI002E1164AF|nr:DUF1349 domain-containing protein [Streptomyces europaeiscabiei]